MPISKHARNYACMHVGEPVYRQVDRKAGRQACKHAGRQARMQASKHASRQICRQTGCLHTGTHVGEHANMHVLHGCGHGGIAIYIDVWFL